MDEKQEPVQEENNQVTDFNDRAYQWIEKRPLVALSLVVVVGIFLYWVLLPERAPAGTGFLYYDADTGRMLPRTLWDWLGLLIVPAALAVGAYLLNRSQKETELKIAKKAREEDREIARQARETEQKIATDRQMQATLEAYYDRMTELLLERNLRGSQPDSEVRSIARARTVAIVKALDGERNNQLFAFLKASELLVKERAVIDLTGADLRMADLSGADLSGIDLSEANLREADLHGTLLFDSNLSRANLRNANLRGANLSIINLNVADLGSADLNEAFLSEGNLRRVNLSETNLSGASLRGTNLLDARLWSLDQFDQVRNLDGVTMPDGIKLRWREGDGPTYEEWKAQYLAKQGSG